MPRHILVPYEVVLKSAPDAAELSKIIKEYLYYCQSLKALNFRKINKIFRVNTVVNQGTLFAGFVETGEYGEKSEIFDIEKNDITYVKQTSEALLLNFYYIFYIVNQERGFLIIHKRSTLGVKSLLEESMRHFLREQGIKADIEFRMLVPENVLNYYLDNASVMKIRFIQYKVHKDIADQYFNGRPNEGYIEVVISARRNRKLHVDLLNLLGLFRRKSANGKIDSNWVSLPTTASVLGLEDIDDIKVELKLPNGQHRTVVFSDLKRLRVGFDVTHEVIDSGADEHELQFDRIHKVALDILRQILSSDPFSNYYDAEN